MHTTDLARTRPLRPRFGRQSANSMNRLARICCHAGIRWVSGSMPITDSGPSRSPDRHRPRGLWADYYAGQLADHPDQEVVVARERPSMRRLREPLRHASTEVVIAGDRQELPVAERRAQAGRPGTAEAGRAIAVTLQLLREEHPEATRMGIQYRRLEVNLAVIIPPPSTGPR